MKYFSFVLFLIIFAIVLLSFQLKPKTVHAVDYDSLKIQIIANSNSVEDQSVKHEIKTAVTNYLADYFHFHYTLALYQHLLLHSKFVQQFPNTPYFDFAY